MGKKNEDTNVSDGQGLGVIGKQRRYIIRDTAGDSQSTRQSDSQTAFSFSSFRPAYLPSPLSLSLSLSLSLVYLLHSVKAKLEDTWQLYLTDTRR